MTKPVADNRGVVHLLLIIAIVAVLGGVGFLVYQKQTSQREEGADNSIENRPSSDAADSEVYWENTSEQGWMAMGGTPPECPSPFMLKSPTDFSKVTSVLYPGQERTGAVYAGQGGNYKPHGGFRFDGLRTDQVSVSSPIDGNVYRGSRYLVDGEIQYTFDIVHPCGMLIRLGHLLALSPTFQSYADKFPAAQEGDSRTERVEGFPKVKAGDPVAIAVGLAGSNTFFDLGVFDLRQTNAASKDPAYQQKRGDAREHTYYAVCWFDMLPGADANRIKSLPAGDPVSGKNSDYCR